MSQNEPQVKKIRILYVVESFSTGVYAIVRDIACNLDPLRFEVRIIHSLRDDSPTDYVKEMSMTHLQLRHVPMGKASDYLNAVRILRQEIESYRPVCIHLHSSKAGFLGRIACRHSGCTHVLYSPHGFSFLRTDVGFLKRRLFFLLEYWVDRYSPAKIIAVSEGELEEARRLTANTMAINNFIDTNTIFPGQNHEETDIVTTGRIAPQKNPALFNEIARSLPDYSFLWIGDGPLRHQLDAPNITITGYIPRSEVTSYLNGSKIYLQTSLWEGMPVSILEAMATAKAIVASDIIGNRDLIEHKVNGMLCDPSSAHEFVAWISELMADETHRRRLGLAAREHAVVHHDLEAAVAKYMHEYEFSGSGDL